MIKASELRIGNIVTIQDSLHNSDSISVTAELIHNLSRYGIEGLKPTLLTEEWLVKFGFDFRSSDLGSEFDGYGFLGKPIWIWKEDGYFTYDEFDNEIKSVHQLQNLYFALTGEELTIKE